jgi:trimethylguanosine synthase
MVYLNRPFSGPSYDTINLIDLEKKLEANKYQLFKLAKIITSNVVYFLSRNVNVEQLISLMNKKLSFKFVNDE